MAINSDLYTYDVKWQTVRVKCLGKWRSVRGVQACTDILRAYLYDDAGGEVSNSELYVRCSRVVNLLNAVRMSYNATKSEGSDFDQVLINFRTYVQTIMKDFSKQEIAEAAFDYSWEKAEKDLHNLYQEDRTSFELIYKDLTRSRDGALERKNGVKFREVLVKYLELMQDVALTVGGVITKEDALI